mgnify:CR=1 FL=1
MENVSVSSFKLGEVDGKKEARDPDFEQLVYLGDGYYNELEEQNKYIIIGRKGTGKSTIFLKLENEYRKRKQFLPCYVDVKTIYESSQAQAINQPYLEEFFD